MDNTTWSSLKSGSNDPVTGKANAGMDSLMPTLFNLRRKNILHSVAINRHLLLKLSVIDFCIVVSSVFDHEGPGYACYIEFSRVSVNSKLCECESL